jgi:hypothetical protein
LEGATDLCDARVRIKFWAVKAEDAEVCAFRFRSLISKFNGNLGGGSHVRLSVHKTAGPFGLYDTDIRYYLRAIDVIGILDTSTVA